MNDSDAAIKTLHTFPQWGQGDLAQESCFADFLSSRGKWNISDQAVQRHEAYPWAHFNSHSE